ncbi:DUF5709 domain-containing protein [Cryptosporangium minutisporangium]|uniref:DUF5709 domain-containing protein n=1 Tax=Cryptosporangium minutisporangium TaxID=113569 RepID=A0ABP6T9Y6_9ACTN
MSTEHYAEPVTDPEAEGLPGYADDDSSANPDRDSARAADGPSPAALPADRPLGATEFGTTANEQREGEPLEDRLRREEPDVTEQLSAPTVADPVAEAEAEWKSTTTDETALDTGGTPRDDYRTVHTTRDLDADDVAAEIDGEAPPAEDAETAATMEGIDPHTDSPVSVYDRGVDDVAGRLVEPDEGAHVDDEPDAIADERGIGGATAEEQAIHVVRDLP